MLIDFENIEEKCKNASTTPEYGKLVEKVRHYQTNIQPCQKLA